VDIQLSLVVIRVSDLEKSKCFYEAIGLRFTRERHGSGPEHYAAEIGDAVFEIYRQADSRPSTGVRLGIRVESLARAISGLEKLGAQVASPPVHGKWGLRAVVIDPDGHCVEIGQVPGT
jgi:lactoylglutathione lyase